MENIPHELVDMIFRNPILSLVDLAHISMVCSNLRSIAESERKQRIETYDTEYNGAVALMLRDRNETVRSAALDIMSEFEWDVIALHTAAIVDLLLDTSYTVREDAWYTMSKFELAELIKYRAMIHNVMDNEQYQRVRDVAARVIHAIDTPEITAASSAAGSKPTWREAERLSKLPSSAAGAARLRVNIRKIEMLQYGVLR